jgi:hypothetical protein
MGGAEMKRIDKIFKVLVPFGMASSVFYIGHFILGAALWPKYNSFSDSIALLTADQSPHAQFLRVLTFLFGICQMVFATGMVLTCFSRYGRVMRAGALVYIVMTIVSMVGFNVFPMVNNVDAGLQNSLHLAINSVVIFFTMISMYLVSIGFFAFEKMRAMGIFSLAAVIGLATFGVLHALVGVQGAPIQGLVERITTCFYHVYVFFVSFSYTFNMPLTQKDTDE